MSKLHPKGLLILSLWGIKGVWGVKGEQTVMIGFIYIYIYNDAATHPIIFCHECCETLNILVE